MLFLVSHNKEIRNEYETLNVLMDWCREIFLWNIFGLYFKGEIGNKENLFTLMVVYMVNYDNDCHDYDYVHYDH